MAVFDTIATVILVLILTAIVLRNRKKLTFHRGLGIFFVAMYRTKTGLKAMDKIAKKWEKWLVKATPAIIIIGFVGMAVVSFDLIAGLIRLLSTPGSPSVGVVLPIEAKGVFYVPFIYWILSIFIILIVHEGAHGIMARVYGLRVKNSGLMVAGALIPLMPGAFVEPDEKKLLKASPKKQLAVYAAGPFANIALALVLLLSLTYVFTPITDSFYSKDGVVISSLMEGQPPALEIGLTPGEKITAVDGQKILEPRDFSQAFEGKSPGDSMNLVTSQAVYNVELGKNPQNDKPWLGVYVEKELLTNNILTRSLLWIKEFVFWLFLLNLGVGLFNLVPLGPIDGGRMFLTGLRHMMHEQKARRVWKTVSVCVLGVLITSIVMAFI